MPSFAVPITNAYGTFIMRVVGYERRKARGPSSWSIAHAQSTSEFLWWPSCKRCLMQSIGVMITSCAIVARATAAPAATAVPAPLPLALAPPAVAAAAPVAASAPAAGLLSGLKRALQPS